MFSSQFSLYRIILSIRIWLVSHSFTQINSKFQFLGSVKFIVILYIRRIFMNHFMHRIFPRNPTLIFFVMVHDQKSLFVWIDESSISYHESQSESSRNPMFDIYHFYRVHSFNCFSIIWTISSDCEHHNISITYTRRNIFEYQVSTLNYLGYNNIVLPLSVD